MADYSNFVFGVNVKTPPIMNSMMEYAKKLDSLNSISIPRASIDIVQKGPLAGMKTIIITMPSRCLHSMTTRRVHHISRRE